MEPPNIFWFTNWYMFIRALIFQMIELLKYYCNSVLQVGIFKWLFIGVVYDEYIIFMN